MCNRLPEFEPFSVDNVAGFGGSVEDSEIDPRAVVTDDCEELMAVAIDTHRSERASTVAVLGDGSET